MMPALQYVPMVLYATSVDALLIGGLAFVAYGVSSFTRVRKRQTYFFLILFLSGALLSAYGIEYHALLVEKWDYPSAMPLIVGIGLSPRIQLAITGAMSILLVLTRERRFL